MVDVNDMRSVREEVGKLIKDIQEMENASNKLLESLMAAVSQTGDMNAVSDKGYLMTLAQMQAVHNTVLCRTSKLLTLLVIWRSQEIEKEEKGEKKDKKRETERQILLNTTTKSDS
ncbi:MAG: hypothetical protein WCI88_00585 [Chloroflexota bacterium]|jgi:dsRNA-specific ribonuclease